MKFINVCALLAATAQAAPLLTDVSHAVPPWKF